MATADDTGSLPFGGSGGPCHGSPEDNALDTNAEEVGEVPAEGEDQYEAWGPPATTRCYRCLRYLPDSCYSKSVLASILHQRDKPAEHPGPCLWSCSACAQKHVIDSLGAASKKCSRCGKAANQTEFTKSQLQKAAHKRTCITCTRDELMKHQAAYKQLLAATTASTASSSWDQQGEQVTEKRKREEKESD